MIPAADFVPIPLPDSLETFLRPIPFAVMNHATTNGAVLIVKLPAAEIDHCRGHLPIDVRYELHRTAWAPVVRLVVTVYDDQPHPFMLETFFNVADPEQLANLRDLIQDEDFCGRVLVDDVAPTLGMRLSHWTLLSEARRAAFDLIEMLYNPADATPSSAVSGRPSTITSTTQAYPAQARIRPPKRGSSILDDAMSAILS